MQFFMPSFRNTLILLSLTVLLITINVSESAPLRYLMQDDLDHRPSAALIQLWLERLQQMEEKETMPIDTDDAEHVWKRFSEFLPSTRQRRRFGNTRYGRSVSTPE